MGFSSSWFAVQDESLDDLIENIGFKASEDQGGLTSGVVAVSVGDWALIHSNDGQLADENELLNFSRGKVVVEHVSIDSVMYSHTTVWKDGRADWSVSVSPEDGVVGTGNSQIQTKTLVETHERDRADAYDQVSDLAEQIVGFRHDNSGDHKFVRIVEANPDVSNADKFCEWLTSDGWIAFDSEATGKDDRYFSKALDGDFVLVFQVNRDNTSGVDGSVSIRCESVEAVLNKPKPHRRPSRTEIVSYLLNLGDSDRRFGDFESICDYWSEVIATVATYASLEKLQPLCRPEVAVAIEVVRGWSDRGEAVLEQCGYSMTPAEHGKLVEELRKRGEQVKTITVPAPETPVAELFERLEKGELLTGPELGLIQLAKGKDCPAVRALRFELWLLALQDPDLLPEIGSVIATSSYMVEKDLERACSILDLPLEVQRSLATKGYPGTPGDLCRNVTVAPEIQVMVARMGGAPGAGNPNIVPEAQRLIMDRADYRQFLGDNPALEDEYFDVLVSSKYWPDRAAVAKNPAAPRRIFEKLVKDRKSDVKRELAGNPSLPEDLQVALVDKGIVSTRNPALAPKAQRAIVERGNILSIAANSALLPEFMEQIAKRTESWEREKVARNPSLTLELQKLLADDPSARVRFVLATNPSTSPEIVDQLKKDPEVQQLDKNSIFLSKL